jgi:hypothetical protein
MNIIQKTQIFVNIEFYLYLFFVGAFYSTTNRFVPKVI